MVENEAVITQKLFKVAVVSRLSLLTLQIIFNAVIPDHDAGVFRKPKPKPQNELEMGVSFILEGLERWDGQYFLSVAEYGYVYEKSLAFFPLFPTLVQLLANSALLPLHSLLSYHLVLLISAVAINFVLFVVTVLVFYRLSCEVLADQHWAYKASLLFCFNPASIFFSAAYSETLFCFLAFTAMHQCQKAHYNCSTALFMLASFARSNGTVNAGFLLYATVMLPILSRCQCDGPLVRSVLSGLLQALLVFLPFVLFQIYAYQLFCNWPPPLNLPDPVRKLATADPLEYVVPGVITPWCSSSSPISYAYIQEHYWGVGFLKYYHLKQLPNFVLAAPTIVLCFHGAFHFAIRILNSLHQGEKIPLRILEMLPYVVHCSFLLVFGITSMHVQVVTRLLASSSPTLCWFAAELLPDLNTKRPCLRPNRERKLCTAYVPLLQYFLFWNRLSLKAKSLLFYFFLYYVVGTAAFVNFLPWT